MSSEAKARAAALRQQFEKEMRQAELLEQEEKRVEELRIQEEERKRQEEEWRLEEGGTVLAEQDRRCRELTARREEERRRREVAMTLARDQHLAEEQRRRFEERTKAAEERAKAREVEEAENTADPGAGPHIETKKRKRAGSGFTILGTLTMANGVLGESRTGRFAIRAVGSIGPVFGGRTTKRCAHVIFAREAKFLVQWTRPMRRRVRQRRCGGGKERGRRARRSRGRRTRTLARRSGTRS